MPPIAFLLFTPEDFSLAERPRVSLDEMYVDSSVYVVLRPWRLLEAVMRMIKEGIKALIIVATEERYPVDLGPFLGRMLAPCIVIVAAQTEWRESSTRAVVATVVSPVHHTS